MKKVESFIGFGLFCLGYTSPLLHRLNAPGRTETEPAGHSFYPPVTQQTLPSRICLWKAPTTPIPQSQTRLIRFWHPTLNQQLLTPEDDEKMCAAVEELSSQDLIGRTSRGEMMGIGKFKDTLRGYRQAFPDLVYTIESIMGEGDRVAGEGERNRSEKESQAQDNGTKNKKTTRPSELQQCSKLNMARESHELGVWVPNPSGCGWAGTPAAAHHTLST